MWEVIRKRTGENKLVNILESLYKNNRGNIANSDIWYQIFGGTRQGGIESPPSFVWYFDFVLKVIRNRISEEIGKTGIDFKFNINHTLKAKRGSADRDSKMNGSVTVPALLFADDETELEYDVEVLEKILIIMDDECARFGLYVSFKKTFTQEWAPGNSLPKTEPEKPLINIIDSKGTEHNIINKTVFKALGVNLDNTDPNGYISHRVAQATGQFHKYRSVLTDYRIKVWVRRKFAESYVRSTLLYGINAECPTEAQIGTLSSFWYYSLRQMTPGGFSAVKNDDGDDTVEYKRSNRQLDEYFGTPPIKDFIHVNYLNYIAHIVRRPNNHPTKQALFIIPDRPHAPRIFTKVRFLLNNIDEAQIIRDMSNRAAFHNLLKRYYPYLKKKSQ